VQLKHSLAATKIDINKSKKHYKGVGIAEQQKVGNKVAVA